METKSSFIAIVGRPNVGKSSLLNSLVGEKVAIVSNKPQTTRTKITGVLTLEDTQLIFLDTPGMHTPHTKLSEYMVRQIQEGMGDVDIVLLITEPDAVITETERQLAESIKQKKQPAFLVFNKIDTLRKKDLLLPKIDEFSKLCPFQQVIPVSAVTGEGLGDLVAGLKATAKPGPFFFDPDSYTDQTERVIVAEIIREKLLNNLQDELPHGTAVEIESMKMRPDKNLMDIDALIYCEKDSHKGMIIGKQGAMLKKISSQSREEIEHFLDTPVFLQVWVKVKNDWRNKEGSMRQMGFK